MKLVLKNVFVLRNPKTGEQIAFNNQAEAQKYFKYKNISSIHQVLKPTPANRNKTIRGFEPYDEFETFTIDIDDI